MLAQLSQHASTPTTQNLNVTHTNVSISLTQTHRDCKSPLRAAQSSDITHFWMVIKKLLRTKRHQSQGLRGIKKMSEVKVQTRGLQPTRTELESRPRAESRISQLVCPANVQTRPWPNNGNFQLFVSSHINLHAGRGLLLPCVT